MSTPTSDDLAAQVADLARRLDACERAIADLHRRLDALDAAGLPAPTAAATPRPSASHLADRETR